MGGARGEIRIGLTISGAIALGAYEGGALAALLCAAQAVNEKRPGALKIDAMAGASAGSITALLAARTLLRGMDPIHAMHEAWVKTPQLEQLTDKLESPLSVTHTENDAVKLLKGEKKPERAQSAPIKVQMALGCLRGLDYSITRISGPPISANTYLDWGEWTIRQDYEPDWYTKPGGPLQTALASGAHAAAFPPKGLDRSSKEVQDRYRDNHIEHAPKFLWYTDGGTIDNEPLGRTLDLTEEIDGEEDPIDDAARLHLMITPDPARPSKEDGPWATREPAPTWTQTGPRTIALMRSQRLYDDLRRLEKTNSRIQWVRRLERELLSIINDPDGDAKTAEESLKKVTAEINGERERLPKDEDLHDKSLEREPGSELEEALRTALDTATGFAKKSHVAVAVVSPFLLPDVANGKKSPHDRLSGEFLGHFGGFFDERLRNNDFILGYESMQIWLNGETGLAHYGLTPELSQAAREGASKRWGKWVDDPEHPEHKRIKKLEGQSFGGLSFRRQLRLYMIAARSAWIVFHQLRKPPPKSA